MRTDVRRNGKLYLLCLVLGALTGLITVPFRWLLEHSISLRRFLFDRADETPLFHLLVLLGMWGVALLIDHWARKYPLISGSGIPQVEGVICGRFHFLHPFKAMCVKFVGGIAGIGMGFSLGREGPSVQMGAFMAKILGRWFHVGAAHQKYLTTGGASAGLSSAFTAPLASAIFVIEEVEKFDSPKIAISSLLGGIVAGWMAKMVMVTNPYAAIDVTPPEDLALWQQVLILFFFSWVLGAVGRTFNYLLLRFQLLYKRLRVPRWFKLFALVLVTYLVGYYFLDLSAGGESALLKEATTNDSGVWLLLALLAIKLLFTPFCYASGFPGGIFLPLLVIGGLTGKLFALFLVNIGWMTPDHFGFYMLIGMAALFAAVVRSPITGLVLILEMTGQFSIFFPMIVVVGITYFVSEMMGVKPIYDQLYQRLLPPDADTEHPIVVPFEVENQSYMEGKTVREILLPKNCFIEAVYRKGIQQSDAMLLLQPGDRVDIRVPSCDLEKLYRSFRSMANE